MTNLGGVYLIEQLIAKHCAPALAGIKPSNIVSCQKSEIKNINDEIKKLNKQLNKKDIYIESLCECEKRVLLIVYRRAVLEAHLNNQKNKAFLTQYGYSEAEVISDYLDILRAALKRDMFPHEIGVFLGYPLRDIYSFINHRDDGCLLIGEWRVYHNPEEAEKMFCRFKSCRNALVRKISEGRTLAQIFCAV